MPTSDNRTVLITGVHQALGFGAAEVLAAGGDRLIVHTDSMTSGELALEQLIKSGADPLQLELVTGDFTDLQDVARLARDVITRCRHLDVLVNAATTVPTDGRNITRDGIERTFQHNYLAPYLLTRLLGNLLTNSGARVVNVASCLHAGASINWNDLNRTHRYAPLPVYGQAALATVMHTTMLRELWGHACTTVSVDPGTTDPGLLRLHGTQTQPDEASPSTLAAICSSSAEPVCGAFYNRLAPRTDGPSGMPRALERLWSRSAELTGLAS